MKTKRGQAPKATTELLEPIEILTKGRRSKVKPFGRAQEKDALRRIVRRTPEVMVKVTGGGKTKAHVLAHLTYITRKGKLEAVNDEHDKYSAKDELQDLMDEWGLDIARGVGQHKIVHNLIFSMPAGTDAAKLHKAVQNFARDEFFGDRPYLMVLHEPETDPSSKKAEHPHVHMVIRAEGFDRKRLHIRKATLEAWRTKFAERLREQGVEANATIREVRGKTRKAKKNALVRLDADKRDSRVRNSKFEQARRDAEQGISPQPWDAKIANRRAKVVEAYKSVASDLRREGDATLAAEVEEFANNLPPIETERQHLAKFVRTAITQQRTRESAAGKEAPMRRDDKTSERAASGNDRQPEEKKGGDVER
jgi:type IV secretion system T-DNA border endonuclease VirD2